MAAIESEPGVSRLVVHMGGIEQRNQYVHVEKGDHMPSRVRKKGFQERDCSSNQQHPA